MVKMLVSQKIRYIARISKYILRKRAAALENEYGLNFLKTYCVKCQRREDLAIQTLQWWKQRTFAPGTVFFENFVNKLYP